MKKNILYLLVIVLFATACEEEFEPGATATLDFAGEWYYELQGEDGTTYWTYDYGYYPLLTYNSSANVANEIWFSDQGALGVKAKFNLLGTQGSFTGPDAVCTDLVMDWAPETTEVDGEQFTVLVDDYAIAEILEGKILPGAATVWQDKEHAKSDSLYLKFELSNATFTFTNKKYTKDGDDYYEMELNPGYTKGDVLDILVFSGHKQTGWEVYIK